MTVITSTSEAEAGMIKSLHKAIFHHQVKVMRLIERRARYVMGDSTLDITKECLLCKQFSDGVEVYYLSNPNQPLLGVGRIEGVEYSRGKIQIKRALYRGQKLRDLISRS